MNCREIISCLEGLAPKKYAESWDNVGLLVGHYDQPVKRIMIALDANNQVIEAAVKENVDLLITHHPMIFAPIKQIHDENFTGKKILALAEHHIAYYAMHTNFDTKGGMARLAAERMGLTNTKILSITWEEAGEKEGIGIIGDTDSFTLKAYGELVKERFLLEHVFVYGDLKREVKKIAIVPGSGKSCIKDALQEKADVLVTGDIGHHEGLDAVDQGLCIIDATHYGLEYIFIEFIKTYLENTIQEKMEIITIPTGCPMVVI